MTLPMFAAAVDAAAVAAMVSVVGTYTLDALRDSYSRAQHRQQCAERLKKTDLAQVKYTDEAILANLDRGIDSLEEAVTANSDDIRVARLDHAEKMFQVCAVLDGQTDTAGVPNCYLSAWAHFNLAFVWKLRGDDCTAAKHMLEMFLVDPFYSRVDFAPALWEHLFLPHLTNIVNWYTKHRKSIVISGTVRIIGEEQDTSFDTSRDFTSNSVNVLDLSRLQTSQLQALEKLYQDSLDENTRQYARYYKDCLKHETVDEKRLPFMPVAEPPLTTIAESCMPPANLPPNQGPSSTGIPKPVGEPMRLGQVTNSSTSSSRHASAPPPLHEFSDFNNPEFELAELRTFTGGGLHDDPDSPNSNFRRLGMENREQAEPTTMSNGQPKSAEQRFIPASTDQNTPPSPKILRSTASRLTAVDRSFNSRNISTQPSLHSAREIESVPKSGEIEPLFDSREIRKAPKPREIRAAPNPGEIRSVLNRGENGAVPHLGEVGLDPNFVESNSASLSRRLSSLPNSGEIKAHSVSEWKLGDILDIKPAGRRPFRQQPDSLAHPAANTPSTVNSNSFSGDGFSSPKMSNDSPRARTGRSASTLHDSSSSQYSDLDSKDRKLGTRRTQSHRYETLDLDLNFQSGRHHSQEFNRKKSNSSRGGLSGELISSLATSAAFGEKLESSDDFSLRSSKTIPSQADPLNDLGDSEASGPPQIQKRRTKSFRDSTLSIGTPGIYSSTRTRSLSRLGGNGFAGSKSARWRHQSFKDDDVFVSHSGSLLGRASETYQDYGDEPTLRRSDRYQGDDEETILARSKELLRRFSESGHDIDNEPTVAPPLSFQGKPSKRYHEDYYNPILDPPGIVMRTCSESYQDNDDKELPVAHSRAVLRKASKADQYDGPEPTEAHSDGYQDDDGEPTLARSKTLPETYSERYQDVDIEAIVAYSRAAPGRASLRYSEDDDVPITARSGLLPRSEFLNSAVAIDQGRDHKYRRSKSVGSTMTSSMATPLTRPPKDYVCPITSQLFDDPVTLETGQTYERIAIQEWLNRGNVTCPITRQKLRQNHLPNTNYVLKRLVDAWKEQNPELAKELGSSPLSSAAVAAVSSSCEFTDRSVSPNLSIDSPGSGRTIRRFNRRTLSNSNGNDMSRPDSPVDVDGLIMDLQPAMSHLSTSENLAECESVMLEIARLILQARGNQRVISLLNRSGAITGMMEVLFNSQEVRVLNVTLILLSVVIAKDDTARQTVVSADPDAGCLVGLLRKGLTSAASVLYQLKLPMDQLTTLDLLPLLVVVIKENEEVDVEDEEQDIHSMIMRPKSAAIMLLDQILTGEDQSSVSQNALALLALQTVPALVSRLDQTKDIDVRTSVISLLLRCIQTDGRCRHMISKITNFAAVVDLLHSGKHRARTVAITFLNELIHLSRRTLCADVLKKIKAGGSVSSMRVLLVYLQMAPLENRPVAASLLLQLDLLEEPRKGSIYREEAVDCLVEALNSPDWPCPAEAANTLIGLSGRFSYSGKPMMKAWLLKVAGIDKQFLTMTRNEQDSNDSDSTYDQEEEERAAIAWERKVAGALVGHDLGTLIEALGQGIQSKNLEVSKPCMIVATWLTHMLPKLPDTGIRQTARNCLLDHFVGVLHTSKDLHQRVLASLAIHSFISDPEGVQELISYVKDISEPLRHLKKSTWTAKEVLRAFTTHGDANSPDLWIHAEQGQLDVTANGEVRALAKAKARIFSGHTDGTIKIWESKKRFPTLLKELKEHTKSVMALTISQTSNRMYSGSLDKSIRVWALEPEEIRCVHVFDLKDAVVGLLVDGPMACIVPHGAGLKVQYEETTTKTLNANKHVQSLAISDGKIFCGCADNSLQEIDPIAESVDVIQHGIRTLLGKKAIYATQVFQDHLYVAGTPVDGIAGKVWKLPDHSLVGSMATTSEVRSMAISEDFIYLGSSSGVIEVWLRQRLLRVSTLNSGSKVICLMFEDDILYSGHEDGKIRMWAAMI